MSKGESNGRLDDQFINYFRWTQLFWIYSDSIGLAGSSKPKPTNSNAWLMKDISPGVGFSQYTDTQNKIQWNPQTRPSLQN